MATAADLSGRTRLTHLNLPFVDATMDSGNRGLTVVGVPIGDEAYVHTALANKLFDKPMWRYAWHLAGMARTEVQGLSLIHI